MLDTIANFINTDIRMMLPIMIAAMGIVYNERCGVLNMGAEGIMLIGALAGFCGSYYTGSPWGGILFAVICGGLLGLLLAFLAVTLQTDQTVIGAAFNILGLGLSTTMFRVIFGVNSSLPEIESFSTLKFAGLSDIPVIGTLFFQYNILVYLAIFVLLISQFVMFRTKLGLKIRACGENPKACDTLGIHVFRLRYGTTVYGGILCAIAGAYLSTAQLSIFTENMVGGRGFMALSAVVFGKYSPLGVLVACLIFGAGQALEVKLAAVQTGIPDEMLQMIPYILAILALTGIVGKSVGPASETVPYDKD